MSTFPKYYVAASIDGLTGDDKLHMSITYMDRDMAPLDEIQRDLATIPLPFVIKFTRVIKVGMDNDITAVEVSMPDRDTEDAIREFHLKHVDPRHISASQLRLHVTSKGHENELLAAGKYRVTHLYMKRRGTDTPLIERTSE